MAPRKFEPSRIQDEPFDHRKKASIVLKLGSDGSYRLVRAGRRPSSRYCYRITPSSALRRIRILMASQAVQDQLRGFLTRIGLACDAHNIDDVLEEALLRERLHFYRLFSLNPVGSVGPPPVSLGELARQLDEASGGPPPTLGETILFLTDEKSRALAAVEWEITLPDGTVSKTHSRADGGATIPHASQSGECTVTIGAIGSLFRDRFDSREEMQPTMLCKGLELTIPACTTTTKRLRRPHALVFGLDCYYPGQRSFLPRTILADASRMLDTLDVLADFLAAMSSRQDWSAIVLGHADPSGSSGNNDEITSARAESAYAFLSGDCDGWLRGLSEDDPEVAARVFLAWVSERFGWDVHTGEEPGWNARCQAALGQYRQQAATHLGATLGEGKRMAEEDWRAAFALMEEALRASLLDSPDGLDALRGQLSVPTHRRIGCGDRLSEQSGTETDPYEDRRVELVLLEDESFLPGDDVLPDYIYSRWVRRVRVPAPSRGALSLSLRAMPGYPVAAVPFMLEAEHHKGEGESSTHGAIAKSRAPLGAFYVKAHTAEPMSARDLAVRVRAALDTGNPVGLIPALTRPGQAAEELANAYARRFGTQLADDVFALTRGTAFESPVTALLTRSGLHPDERVVLHGLQTKEKAS